MSNLGAAGGGACNERSNLADVVDKHIRAYTNTIGIGTDGTVAVEILAAYGDGLNTVGELGTVSGDGSAEGGELVVEVSLTSRSPQSEEKGCGCVDGSGDSRDDGVSGSSLDHGVETGTGEARSALEILCVVEEVNEALFCDGRAIGVCGAIVEALDCGVGSRDGGREGEEGF